MNDRKDLNYSDEISLICSTASCEIKNITFQVTNDCNLKCSYCYQINKGKKIMPFSVAKKLVDAILIPDSDNSIINHAETKAVILDFIGGEPLLQAKLIEQIIDYFQLKALELDSPLKNRFRASLCTNGVLFFSPDAQHLIKKYGNILSIAVTVDGCKEMHDACRLFPSGAPSYDIAVAADKALLKINPGASTKLTISPENVNFVYKASVNMLNLGHKVININCVFEEGWTKQHAKILYYQLKKVADYLLSLPDPGDIYYALFNENNYRPMDSTDTQNWCGGTGAMIACDPDGKLYPCLRYMESSLGTSIKPLIIGDVDTGIYKTAEAKQIKSEFDKITRQSQSTDECINCPIAQGCAWCSAYNYQKFGTANHRATFICPMHKAASLANVYYWNKRYKKENINKQFNLNCNILDAIEIVGKSEVDYLLDLSQKGG